MNFASVVRTSTAIRTAEMRVAQYDWRALSKELSGYGCAVIKNLLSPEECRQIAGLYPEEGRFRSRFETAFADYIEHLQKRATDRGKPASWAANVASIPIS